MSGFDINQLTISGNLTRDPELRNLPSGQSVCNIRIAHNERRKTPAEEWIDVPAYFDVTIWSGLGEWIAANVAKGDKVIIAGRLRWREYDVEGTSRQAVDITADSVVPVPRSTSSEPAPQPAKAAKKAPAKTKAAA
ncbi:MAG: single-stranded DNA-binding protein [Actinobacteria bacterium]|nr:single-stranded DNA-binding protein [Actinomycetota bacterium]